MGSLSEMIPVRHSSHVCTQSVHNTCPLLRVASVCPGGADHRGWKLWRNGWRCRHADGTDALGLGEIPKDIVARRQVSPGQGSRNQQHFSSGQRG